MIFRHIQGLEVPDAGQNPKFVGLNTESDVCVWYTAGYSTNAHTKLNQLIVKSLPKTEGDSDVNIGQFLCRGETRDPIHWHIVPLLI